jgi:hypothetical protein
MSRFVEPAAGQSYSVYKVTLSTLRRPHDDAEREQLERVLYDFQRYLTTPEGYDAAFGSNGADDQATIRPGRAEVGDDPRGSRVHVHFVAETLHAGLHSAPEVQRRMREAFLQYAQDHGVQLNGAYAYVQLDNSSYGLNYTIKYGRQRTQETTKYVARLQRELADAKKKLNKR